jgi:hypothetical protein
MNRRTRYFLIGSGLVVVVGLCTGLVASYSGQLPGAGSAPGPAELMFLPPDSSAIAFADVDGIMNSAFRQKLRQILPAGAEKDRLLAETGIDIERDIDLVVASLGTGSGAPGPGVVILRGRFDPARIEALATQHGGTVQEYQGRRLVVGPERDAGGAGYRTPGVAFLDGSRLAIGDLDALRAAIDAAGASPDVTGNAELMDLVEQIERTGNAWIVGRFDGIASAPQLPEPVKAQMDGIEWFAVSAQVAEGISGFVRAETLDQQAAEDLRAVINGALAAARMATGQDPRVGAVIQSLQSTGTGTTVQLSFQVGPEIVDLMGNLRQPQ